MNRTIAQLSLAIALLIVGTITGTAKAEDTTPAENVGAKLSVNVSEADKNATQVLQNAIVGVRQFEARPETFTGEKPKRPFRITLSRYFADSDSILRGAGSLASFNLEYDYRTGRFLGGPGVISVFADINNNSRYVRNASADYNATVIGVGIAARRVFTQSMEKNHAYLGAGIGIYGSRYKIDPFGPEKYTQTEYGPGIRLIAGYQFSKSFYVQSELLALDSLRIRNANGQNFSANPSGVRLGIGYRFQ